MPLPDLQPLKSLPRTGWVRAGVPDPETVAAHTWGVSALVLLLATPEVDLGRALAMAVLHDLAELRTGDITPHDGVSPSEKHRREARAMADLLPDRPDLVSLWEEYEARQSPEARLVQACDKLDMALQARSAQARAGLDLSEFVATARRALEGTPWRTLVPDPPCKG